MIADSIITATNDEKHDEMIVKVMERAPEKRVRFHAPRNWLWTSAGVGIMYRSCLIAALSAFGSRHNLSAQDFFPLSTSYSPSL